MASLQNEIKSLRNPPAENRLIFAGFNYSRSYKIRGLKVIDRVNGWNYTWITNNFSTSELQPVAIKTQKVSVVVKQSYGDLVIDNFGA